MEISNAPSYMVYLYLNVQWYCFDKLIDPSNHCLWSLNLTLCNWYLIFQVAERALFLWNNDHIENLIIQNRKVILPIIFPALEKNARNHWNQAVHSLTLNVRKIFFDLDPELFKECLAKFREYESKEGEIEARREATWKRLEELAEGNVPSNKLVPVPQKVQPSPSSG